MEKVSLMEPMIQYGFAGFCIVQFCFIVWMVNKLIQLLPEVTRALQKNTEAVEKLHKMDEELKELMVEIKDNLLSRPCLHK